MNGRRITSPTGGEHKRCDSSRTYSTRPNRDASCCLRIELRIRAERGSGTAGCAGRRAVRALAAPTRSVEVDCPRRDDPRDRRRARDRDGHRQVARQGDPRQDRCIQPSPGRRTRSRRRHREVDTRAGGRAFDTLQGAKGLSRYDGLQGEQKRWRAAPKRRAMRGQTSPSSPHSATRTSIGSSIRSRHSSHVGRSRTSGSCSTRMTPTAGSRKKSRRRPPWAHGTRNRRRLAEPLHRHDLEERALEGRVQQYESVVRDGKGRTRNLLVAQIPGGSSAPHTLFTVAIDVTAQRTAEREGGKGRVRASSSTHARRLRLRDARRRLEIRLVNPALTEFLDRPAADLIGEAVWELVAEAEREQLREQIEKLSRRGGRLGAVEVSLLHSDGELRVIIDAAFDTEGGAHFGIATFRIASAQRDAAPGTCAASQIQIISSCTSARRPNPISPARSPRAIMIPRGCSPKPSSSKRGSDPKPRRVLK